MNQEEETQWAGRVKSSTAVAASAAATAVCVAVGVSAWASSTHSTWVLARAGGIVAYVLLTAVILVGLTMSAPRSSSAAVNLITKLRAHIVLVAFTIAFILTHAAALAVDPWAGLGWAGAAIPGVSSYRPIPVAIGVVAAWAVLIVAVSAALAGRVGGRGWLYIHRVAILVWAGAWTHSVLAGTDTAALTVLYLTTGAAVLVMAVWRYAKKGAR